MGLRRSAVSAAGSSPVQVGLYDQWGMLRFAGAAEADCLDYAALFDLAPGCFSLESLVAITPGSQAGCSS